MKCVLLHRAEERLIALVNNIRLRRESDLVFVDVRDVVWDIRLFSDYIFFQARAILDVFQKVHSLLYSRLPYNSFNDFRKNVEKKSYLEAIKNTKYKRVIVALLQEQWLELVLGKKNSISVRTLLAHNSQPDIQFVLDEDGRMTPRLVIGEHHICQWERHDLSLLDAIESIIDGIDRLAQGLESSFTKEEILASCMKRGDVTRGAREFR